MADQRDLELLEDFITQRMSDEDRIDFEKRIQADPDLQHEHALQERLIKGIRDARVAQLKSMLNNVPVPASSGGSVGAKIALATFVTAIVAGTIWYVNREEAFTTDSASEQVTPAPSAVPPAQDTAEEPEETSGKDEATGALQNKPGGQIVETDKNQTSAGTEESRPSLAKKPAPVAAPADGTKRKLDNNELITPGAETNYVVSSVSPTVEIDRQTQSAQYQSHYKLQNNKLTLYGPFQTASVSEFIVNGKRSVFLVRQNDYFRLSDTGGEVRSLTPLDDEDLIEKLKAQSK